MGESRRKRLLGETGAFPRGKLNADHEGGLRLAVGVQDKTVIIAFGKEVAWLGMSKPEALELAETIRKRAEEIQ